MDFENARWVKLYCQDTGTWLRLGWQGRTMALHLLRSVNSSGVLSDLGTEPELILSELLRLPIEVVTPGLAALVRTGTVTLGGGILVWTAFVDAQRSRKSETQRKAEYRAKHRQEAISGQSGTSCPESGTERPESVPVCPECPTLEGQKVPEEKRREEKRKEKTHCAKPEPPQPELDLPAQQAAGSEPDKPQGTEAPKRVAKAQVIAQTALALFGELQAARKRCNPGTRKVTEVLPGHTREIERCLRDGLTADQVRHVIAVWEELVKAGKREGEHFGSVSPFRAGNVMAYVEMSIADAKKPRTAPQGLFKPQEPAKAPSGNPAGGLDFATMRKKSAEQIDPKVQTELDKLLGRV